MELSVQIPSTTGHTTYRNTWRDWNYIFAVLGQRAGYESSPGGIITAPTTDTTTSPGGYAAVYNSQIMGVYGYDGEQCDTEENFGDHLKSPA